MPRKATITDYIAIQGGKPTIESDGGLYRIRHAYRDDEPEIVTHISPAERGTVIIDNVEYEVAYLWQFEGGPCESKSRSVGGEGYTRHGKEKY
jgi:hypothetical protein